MTLNDDWYDVEKY